MKEQIEIKIDAQWGSEFQKETIMNTLALMLEAWAKASATYHRANHFSVQIGTKATDQ